MLQRPFNFLLPVVAIFLFVTWNRNNNWEDEIKLFEHDAPHLERSACANNLIANRYYDLATKQTSDNAKAMLIQKCIKHYNLAIAADSSVYTALNNLGAITYGYYRDPARALSYFLATIRIEPTYPQAYENGGDCYMKLGNKDSALLFYKKALALDAKQYRSYLRLADILMEREKYREAASLLEPALNYFPESFPLYEKSGTSYLKSGNTKKGLAELERAYTIFPDTALRRRLSELFIKQGDSAKASFYATPLSSGTGK